MKKVLVTGATGFIGNYVINELIKKNVEIIATSTNVEKAMQKKWFNNVTYIPFQISNENSTVNLFNYFKQPDYLIHLAWDGLPNYKSSFHVEKNLPHHFLFIQNLIKAGLNNVSITGTCLEYGMQEGCLNEEMKVFPDNSYAIAKNELRKQIENLQTQCEFDFKWIRLFYMYGKGQGTNSLLSQLEKAIASKEKVFNMSGGEQVRDYLPIEEVAKNIVAIALQNTVTGIINCCSNNPVTIKEFILGYLKKNHKHIELNLGYYPYPDYEPMKFWGDNNKIKKITNE